VTARSPSKLAQDPSVGSADKSAPETTTTLSQGEIDARIAVKNEYLKNFVPPVDEPRSWNPGLFTADQAPIASAQFSPTTEWTGLRGDAVLTIYAGSAGRDNPSEGAVFLTLQGSADGTTQQSTLVPVPGSETLRISSVSSYGNLVLVDSSGRNFVLDATDAAKPTITATSANG
jgi:hypothetical protein